MRDFTYCQGVNFCTAHRKKNNSMVLNRKKTHQISAQTGTEVVEHAISVRLRHFRVNVITAVSKIGDFLC